MDEMVKKWLEVWPDIQKDHGTEYFIPWMTIAFWMSRVGEHKHQQGRMIAAQIDRLAPPDYKEWARQQPQASRGLFWGHFLPKTCAVLNAGKWNGLFSDGHSLASEWMGGGKEGEEAMLFEISLMCDLMVLNGEIWVYDFQDGPRFIYTSTKPRHRPNYTRETRDPAPSADDPIGGVQDPIAESPAAATTDESGREANP